MSVDFQVESSDLILEHKGKRVALLFRYISGANLYTVVMGYINPSYDMSEAIYNSGDTPESKIVAEGGVVAFMNKILPAINAALLLAFPASGSPTTILEQLDEYIKTKLKFVVHTDNTVTVEVK